MFRHRLQLAVKELLQKKPINKVVIEAQLLAKYCQERMAVNQSKNAIAIYANELEKRLQENRDKIRKKDAYELEDAIDPLKTIVNECDTKFYMAILSLREKVVDEKDKAPLLHLLMDVHSKVQRFA